MPAIFAHRGARRVAPENTEAAFQMAVELGADGIELDVRLTADGSAVIHHDAALEDGRNLYELPLRDLPDSVPSLHAALDACGSVVVNIELKHSPNEPNYDDNFDVVQRVIDELDVRNDDPSRWLISSFDLATVNEFHCLRPEVPTAFLTAGDPTTGLALTIQHGHSAWHPWWEDLNDELVSMAHDHGIAVHAWTCNEPKQIASLLALGVDGVITDVPDIALAVRDQAGQG
ncbi:MAG: glycerophosphodiester phosphodiesterase [Ilumatobacteraceae bacterium]